MLSFKLTVLKVMVMDRMISMKEGVNLDDFFMKMIHASVKSKVTRMAITTR